MTQVESMPEENQKNSSCGKKSATIPPNKIVGVGGTNNNNNNNISHQNKGKGIDKTKIPSPLPGHKGKHHNSLKIQGLKTFKLHYNNGDNQHQPKPQVISIKLERLHDWAHFLEEVNNNGSLVFPTSIRQIYTLEGQSLSSLSDLEHQSELIVSGEEAQQLSSSTYSVDKHKGSVKSQIRPASGSKVRRFIRANFTKSVIIEPTPGGDLDEDLGENNSLMKTFSEQNVSYRTHVSNSLNSSPLPNSSTERYPGSRPRPVSCFSTRAPTENGGERKMKNSSLSPHTPSPSSVSRIPKRISGRIPDGIMTTSTPASIPSPSRLAPRVLPQKQDNNKLAGKNRTGRTESVGRDFVLPRIVTIIVKGRKPRKTSRFLLNKKTAIAFWQVLTAITESVKPDWGAIRKVYTLMGDEVKTLEDFFKNDKVFLVCSNDRISQEDFELDVEECKMLKMEPMPLKRGKGLEYSKSPNRRTKGGVESTQSSSRVDPKSYPSHPKQLQASEYPDRITQRYFIGDIIGDGNFAVVRECTDKINGEKYALKVIDKSKCNRDTPPDHEVTILTKVLHPNIILFFDKFNFNNELYVIMELVPGGDLFDAIAAVTKFPEAESACMTRDVASALSFLHSKNIVHRDIKPENLLVSFDNNGQKRIKLGDFGLAQEITGPLYTVCGTPTYVSPEILAETGYGKAVDVWALGVILYVLLCGYPPFVSPTQNQQDLFDMILAADFEFHPENWDEISDDAKNLISLMLEIDPELRLESDEVLNHPWLAGNSEDGSEKRHAFSRRDDFKFSIFEQMGLTKLHQPTNALSNSSI